MKFDLKSDVSVCDILPHHDVVFRAPICDPLYGLPIGNGSTGALLWLGEDTLHVQINHTDLIDDVNGTDNHFEILSLEDSEERKAVCRNGARLDIKFECPVFENIYQKSFESRISLADATAKISADTSFCKTDVSAFCSEKYNCTVLSVNSSFDEPSKMSADLQRWGSRVFSFWYRRFRNEPETGLSGTDSFCADNTIGIIQKLSGTVFCIAAKSIQATDCKSQTSHRATMDSASLCDNALTLIISVGVAENESDAKSNALACLDKAYSVGIDKIYEEHKRAWAEFWNKSCVILPDDQDFPENLWYLNMYYANSQMKGRFPAHFCNGVWGFYHDYIPWSLYFHYNGQLATFPLEAANHPELLNTYYSFRFSQLETAKIYAKDFKNASGLFYTDTCDYKGRMDTNTKDNCTCGPQIAMGMYSHYLYTGDEEFLKNTALPIMTGTAEFYISKLKLGSDGYYHLHKTQGYEGSPLFDDSITDLSMIRALFSALLSIYPDCEKYSDILKNLAPFEETEFLDDDISENGTFSRGIGKGITPFCENVLSVGRDENNKKMRRTFANPGHDYYGFPDTEMAPLFPSGITGLSDKDSKLFKMIQNSACIHHEVKFHEDDPSNEDEQCMGWCMMPIYLARLGFSDLLKKQLEQTISGWIHCPQGFGFYTPSDKIDGHLSKRFKKYSVTKMDTNEKTSLSSWNFRHFDYETLPVIATSINEMLLQSYDGIIRLFPAVRKNASYAFRLAACGGFLIEAYFSFGKCSAKIDCRRAGKLCLAFDEAASASFKDVDGNQIKCELKDGIYTFDTECGQIIYADFNGGADFEKSYQKNSDSKHFGSAMLGCDREIFE